MWAWAEAAGKAKVAWKRASQLPLEHGGHRDDEADDELGLQA